MTGMTKMLGVMVMLISVKFITTRKRIRIKMLNKSYLKLKRLKLKLSRKKTLKRKNQMLIRIYISITMHLMILTMILFKMTKMKTNSTKLWPTVKKMVVY